MPTNPSDAGPVNASQVNAGQIYFEFTPVGSVVKVAAIHAATGIEVVVMGSAKTKQADLQRLALQKLKARPVREAE